MTVTVRPLTAADAVAFRDVRLEALEREPGAYGSTHADWAALPLSRYVARIEGCVVFGLFTEAGLEGILAYDREGGGNARHRAAIQSVYVRGHLRGTGAVDALLKAAIAQGRAEGVVQLELSVAVGNTAAIAAYARHGFERVAVWPRALCHGGRYEDEALMILRLEG